MNPYGLQLRYFRKERGISLKELAEQVQLSEKTLSAIETGRRRPLTGEALQKICNYLGLSAGEAAAPEQAALDSLAYIRIPHQATPMEYRLVHHLIRSLGFLSRDQIAGIHSLLHANTNPARSPQ